MEIPDRVPMGDREAVRHRGDSRSTRLRGSLHPPASFRSEAIRSHDPLSVNSASDASGAGPAL